MDAAAPDPCLGIPGDAGVAPGHMAGPAAFCPAPESWLQTLGCEMKLTVLEKGNATWGRSGLYMQGKNPPTGGENLCLSSPSLAKKPNLCQANKRRGAAQALCACE